MGPTMTFAEAPQELAAVLKSVFPEKTWTIEYQEELGRFWIETKQEFPVSIPVVSSSWDSELEATPHQLWLTVTPTTYFTPEELPKLKIALAHQQFDLRIQLIGLGATTGKGDWLTDGVTDQEQFEVLKAQLDALNSQIQQLPDYYLGDVGVILKSETYYADKGADIDFYAAALATLKSRLHAYDAK